MAYKLFNLRYNEKKNEIKYHKWLKVEAARNGICINKIIISLIKHYLKNKKYREVINKEIKLCMKNYTK